MNDWKNFYPFLSILLCASCMSSPCTYAGPISWLKNGINKLYSKNGFYFDTEREKLIDQALVEKLPPELTHIIAEYDRFHPLHLARTRSSSLALWDGSLYYSDKNWTDINLNKVNPSELMDLVPLPQGEKVIQISAGYSSFCVLTDDGKIYRWTKYHPNQNPPTQIQIPFEKKLVRIYQVFALYDSAIFALTQEGEIYVWDEKKNGARLGLGISDSLPQQDDPDRIGTEALRIKAQALEGKKIVELQVDTSMIHALTDTGEVFVWGEVPYEYNGTMKGIGITPPMQIEIPAEKKIIQLNTRGQTVYALTSKGEMYTWGGVNGYAKLDHYTYLQYGRDYQGVPEGARYPSVQVQTPLGEAKGVQFALGNFSLYLVMENGKIYQHSVPFNADSNWNQVGKNWRGIHSISHIDIKYSYYLGELFYWTLGDGKLFWNSDF